MKGVHPLSPKAVIDWMRTTDLAELSYRRGEDAVQLRLEEAGPAPDAGFPPCALVPVTSPEVGIFRSSDIGKPLGVEKGKPVKEGDVLGLIETGTSKHKVKAAAAGRLVSVLIEDGKAVEYGQPLFFVRP